MKEDPRQRRLGTIEGARDRKQALKWARTHWPKMVVTKVYKIEGTPRYGGKYEVFGRPRKRGRRK